MELNENLKNNLLYLRKDRNVTQEVLAAALDISVQAISKWETGVSLPDIMQLPRIAKFYGVTIDYLFFNEGKEKAVINGDLPDDDTFRVIQFLGNRMLGAEAWEKDKILDLKIPEAGSSGSAIHDINVEIWGSANIKGDIGGNAECGGSLNCRNIGGNAECQGPLNCGNISGNAECGDRINCGNIGGNAQSGAKINCANIGGCVEAGGAINCSEIRQNVECSGDISCNEINGQVTCEGNIRCKEIKGDVNCEGDIIYEK